MTEKVYEMMNWPQIEAVCFGEVDHPHTFLGATVLETETLIQTFYPDAHKIFCVFQTGKGKTEKEMERADDAGFFAGLYQGKHVDDYSYKVVLEDGEVVYTDEVYNLPPVLQPEDCRRFQAGVHYEIYQYLGAHPRTINGKQGVYFAVWAPNAMRVSVVGDFNDWNGLRHPMRRLDEYGIFELFIPQAKIGQNYKFEICIKGGATVLKADPYANAMQLRPDTASVITQIDDFTWTDKAYLEKRAQTNLTQKPVSVYEVHLGSFAKPDDGREFYNYRELAPMLSTYAKRMGYTHVELLPIMEHPLDASWGYQTIGYYAPTARYGTAYDLMFFINEMHKADIGVILDWVPSHFPRDTHGLSCFDGTCLYEHLDPKRSFHPLWGTLNYNYARPEVKNYLIANALYWISVYHADGIRMDAVASMLYLDYGKEPGQWYANMFGGNENLEAIEFIKHFNSIVHKKFPGVITVAEESTVWPKVTGELNEDGLGFDFKWNIGWMNDYLKYISYDPYFRAHHHNELTYSMIYAYTDKYMLEFSHDEVTHGKGSMLQKMPGTIEEKFANLRLSLAYMMVHPGKKLLFMGQDFAQIKEWNESESISWELLKEEAHTQFNLCARECNQFYKKHPALYELDYKNDGFSWINNMLAKQNMLIFLRTSIEKEETLLIVANFANVARNQYQIGVPFPGKYKEIFNTDYERFGGSQYINARVKTTKEIESDYRPYSIRIRVAPLSISIFQYTGETIVSLEDEKKKRGSAKETANVTKLLPKKTKKAVIQPMKHKK